LTKVEDILPEEAMAVGGTIAGLLPALCAHNSPAVSCVGTSVPEQHPGMPTALKHLKFHKMPPSALMFRGLAIAPTMQAIIVDCVSIVNPQFAPIVRNDAKAIMACPEDSHAACPSCSKVVASFESRPFLACVAIVNSPTPSSHVWSATVQVRAPTTLTEVVDVLSEKPSTISSTMTTLPCTTCTRNNPTVASIRTMVPEEHASMTAVLKHLEPHQVPSGTHLPPGGSAAPAVQAIIINCVSIVQPEIAPVIGDDLEVVAA
jgi:hypothetical protein